MYKLRHILRVSLANEWNFKPVELSSQCYSTNRPIGLASYKESQKSNFDGCTPDANFPVKQEEIVSLKDITSLKKWLDLYKFSGGNTPETIKDKHMEILLQRYQISIFQATKYLNFLFKTEMKRKNQAVQKLQKKELQKEKMAKFSEELEQNNHLLYRLWHNSMYGRMYKSSIINLDHHRLSNSLKYGQPLIIDLGFESQLPREFSSLCKQLSMTIHENMRDSDPFNLHLCNLNKEKLSNLQEYVQILQDPILPMNVTHKNYLELFPKEKLVYLTPDSKVEMKEYNHDAIYIIGGIVDLASQKPLTLAKAKKEGIKTMKLPLRKFVEFKSKPSLGLHVMIAIMLELQESGDFEKAFKNIPLRLLECSDMKFGETRWDVRNDQFRSQKNYKNL